MRIIYTVNDAAKARMFSAFLIGQGIDNQLEQATHTDWGSHDYGDTVCKIWIYDEDQLEQAMHWVDEFTNNPDDPVFKKGGIKAPVQTQMVNPEEQTSATKPMKIILGGSNGKRSTNTIPLKVESFGRITIGFLILCVLIFIIGELTAPAFTSLPNNLPLTPLTAAPIKKQLLYDYPQSYVLLDKLVKLYGVNSLQSPQDLPPEGQFLLTEFHKTPYWQGYYDILVNRLQGGKPLATTAPQFEKIKQGEVWRLFTPCLLHNDILHIIFNMIWLIVLGKQIEQRLNPKRYILLIIMIGILSNTCQYLVTGPNFLGFSGVICGMLTFIWVRQKVAPWEGYPLERATILFMIYFIIAMLMIQLVSFYLEVQYNMSVAPGIANTAHFAGAAIGALLGRLSFFSWKTNQFKRPPT